MSLQTVAQNHLLKSGNSLSSLETIADLLLQDVFNCIDKRKIEPTHDVEFALLSAATTLNQAIIVETADSQIFFDYIRNRAETEIRKTIGHSPGWLDDVSNWIIDSTQTVIEDVIDQGKETIIAIQKGAENAITLGQTAIAISLATISGQAAYRRKKAKELLDAASEFIGNAIDFILSAIASAIEVLGLLIQLAINQLADKLGKLLRISPGDLFDLQKQLSNLFMEEKASQIKKTVEETPPTPTETTPTGGKVL